VRRTLDEVTPAVAKRIDKARAKVRAHVWAPLETRSGLPASQVAGTDLGETVVLDVDTTLVTVHSTGIGTGSEAANWCVTCANRPSSRGVLFKVGTRNVR